MDRSITRDMTHDALTTRRTRRRRSTMIEHMARMSLLLHSTAAFVWTSSPHAVCLPTVVSPYVKRPLWPGRTAMASSQLLSDSASEESFLLTSDNCEGRHGSKTVSSRSQRKAVQRAKKQANEKVKVLSDHPEAVLKRQLQLQLRKPKSFATTTTTTTTTTSPQVTSDLSLVNNSIPIPQHQQQQQHYSHSRLDPVTTTAQDVVKAIKRVQNSHDTHDLRHIAQFLLEQVDSSFAYGYRGSLLSRLAVAALHLHNHDIAQRCITERRTFYRSSMLPLESAAILRGLLRSQLIKEAWEVLEDELSMPLSGWINFHSLEEEETRRQLDMRDRLLHRARSIGSIASRHFYQGEPTLGMHAMQKLKDMGKIMQEAKLTAAELELPWEKLVRGAALCESQRREGKWENTTQELQQKQPWNSSLDKETTQFPCNFVYTVLDAMIAFPSDNNDGTFEALCNALVRRTVFVTGAVDMEGCPMADRGEAAFIGRSNVGKSSLVNMLTNRKSLAFTSKTPGKTQQFNFFAVNDKPELERQIRYGDNVLGSKDRDSFYMVDLPGFGFAKAPQKQRERWSEFMEEYLDQRENLRVVFHLIDARHGPTEEDAKIMRKVGSILNRKQTQYVVILTKADKNVKGADSEKNPGKVGKTVYEKLLETMKESSVGYAPVILTSAETRLGRDEVWKYLRLAAEGK